MPSLQALCQAVRVLVALSLNLAPLGSSVVSAWASAKMEVQLDPTVFSHCLALGEGASGE